MEQSGDLERGFRRGVRWSLLGSAGATVFQFLQMAVFARFATPEQSGDYALAATLLAFVLPLAEGGLGQAAIQMDEIDYRELDLMAWINTGIGLLCFVFLLAASPYAASWYGRPELPGLLALMGVSLVVIPFGMQSAGLTIRAMRFDLAAGIDFGASFLSFFLVAVLSWRGWGAWAMAAGFMLRNTTSTSAYILLERLFVSPGRPWRKPFGGGFHAFIPGLKSWGVFGAYDLAGRMADVLSNYLDKLIVGKWLGVAALGYYNLAFSLFVIPTARLGYVVTRVSYPVFARLKYTPIQLQTFFQQTQQQIVVALFPLYTAMILFSKEVVLLIYGPQWLPAAPLLLAFGIAGWVRSCSALFPHLAWGIGKPQWQFVWMLLWTIGLNTFLVFGLLMEPSLQVSVWSRVAAKYTLEIGLLFWLAKRCGVDFLQVLAFSGKVLLWLLPVAAVTALAGYLNCSVIPAMMLKASIFGAGMVILYWKSPLGKEWVKMIGREKS